ncbi:hypothetical protein SCHPADRAFT_903089 [Schizopora paradoxa]|uniref:Activator of Hsp90 ATPase AHSA1-like N-terminal domain-containing protein n=1 Tax=Schizopora paradoxa TaxID=27342 RepID=A0A0H2RST8_9AGAM|nr:hypothetical protein SCHPADRAFT_903089 [Schizopora paradoxa]
MTTMPASTANWHWKEKNITPWGKDWFERELVTVTVKGDGEEVVSISSVTDFEGDVEVKQRKSKIITIFECKIDCKWSGTAEDGTEVSGVLKIPEVSHENTLDGLSEYTYEWSLSTDSSPAVDKLYKLAKSRLPVALETKFAEFPTAIIDTHARDIQISAEPSRTGSPAPAVAAAASTGAKAGGQKVNVVKREEKPINTSKVELEATFMASADDLFGLFTDEQRIPMWTRAPAQSKPEVGGSFSMFAGGVKGSYVSLERPTKVVQKWALSSPSWPSDHYGTMTITFDQSSDSTKVTLLLQGVPTGMEDEIRRNLEGYYIHGLKSIGYVQLIVSHSSAPPRSSSSSWPPSDMQGTPPESFAPSRTLIVVMAVVVLVAAFAIPFR